jgi:hypothetical protein
MKVKSLSVLMLTALSIAALVIPTLAAVTVTIGGNSISSPSGCATGGTEVIISDCNGAPRIPFTGACFTIAGSVPNTPAKVTADNAAIDKLYLNNALIKSTAANCISDVLFFDTFTAGPVATTKSVTFTRSTNGVGSLVRPSTNQGALGSYFKVTGWINDNGGGDNEIATYQQKTVLTATDYQFNFSKTETWNPTSLQANRVMKARFWFKLSQAQDELRLTNGVAVESTAGGGLGGGREDESIANDPSITTGHEACYKKNKCTADDED